jgi:type IV pilus assembly protein PilV
MVMCSMFRASSTTARRRRRRQSGFTLIETLIALLVISVGLLSVAGLQLLSKRSNYDAAQRTTAAHLAYDLLERMRNNPAGLINYMPGDTLGGNVLGDGPDVMCTDAGVSCDPEELAAFDLWQWEELLDGALETVGGEAAGGLVNPTACITGPGFGGSGVYTVAIAWRGLTGSADPGDVNDCGQGLDRYGDDDAYRRVLVVRTFINAS